MHELSIVIEVARRVEQIAREEKLTHVERIVLQVGELSSVIPGYLKQCYPAAVAGTILETTELIIETLPGNVRCSDCGSIYRFLENRSGCPNCGSDRRELLCGREFILKEIVAY